MTLCKPKHREKLFSAFAESNFSFSETKFRDKYSRWMSCDTAVSDYIPASSEQAKKLGGMGGVYNLVNMNFYHYGANNPLKYKDPTGMEDEESSPKKFELNLNFFNPDNDKDSIEGIENFQPQNQLGDNSEVFKDSDVYCVGGHGNKDTGIKVDPNSEFATENGCKSANKDNNISIDTLGDLIKADPNSRKADGNYKTIILFSCSQGEARADGGINAQDHADTLGNGANVVAPDGVLLTNPTGWNGVVNSATSKVEGQFKRFVAR